MRTKMLRIGMGLVASLLAVVLPQQNALGEVINTEGTGDASLRDIPLSGIELSPVFSPDNTRHYKAWVESYRQRDYGDGHAQRSRGYREDLFRPARHHQNRRQQRSSGCLAKGKELDQR